MSKQFVVRLRKGSPTGNIVANSQVITIDSLPAGTIFPSNFTDGRLQGQISTLNRVSNFIKTIVPSPTTTTTLPPLTTTTTQAGQTTSTTSTTTKANTPYNNYKIEVSTADILEGQTVLVKCYLTSAHPPNQMWLSIKQTNVNGQYRPDSLSIASPSIWTIAEKSVGVIGSKFSTMMYYQEVSITLKSPLAWVTDDVNFRFELYQGSSTNPNPTSSTASNPVAFTSMTLKKSSRGIAVYKDAAVRDYFLPNETMTLVVTGLTANKKYAVALSRTLTTRPRATDVSTSFIAPSETFSEGWTQGGQSIGLFKNTPANWWYTFQATSATKNITLTFASSITFDSSVNSYPFELKLFLIDEPSPGQYILGTTSIGGASSAIELLSSNQGYYISMLKDNASVLEGSSQTAELVLKTGRKFITEDNINYLTIVVLPGNENPSTLNGTNFSGRFTVESSENSGPLIVENIVKDNSIPGVFNYRFNLNSYGTSRAKWDGEYTKALSVSAPTATSGNQGGPARIKVYATSGTTLTEDKLVANIAPAFTLVDSLSPPVITNWTPNPSTNQINEILAKNFSVRFTITDTVVRTIYWQATGVGITESDFEGPYKGNFNTGIGSITVDGGFRLRNDNTIEPDEKLTVNFFLTENDLNTGQNAFYVSPVITVSDGTNLVNEQVKIADSNVPPYYTGDSITLIITGGVPNDRVSLTDGITVYPSFNLDASGNFTVTSGPFNDVRLWTLTLLFDATKHERTVSFTIQQRPTGDAGSGEPPPVNLPGYGGACPDPATLIMITANESKAAGELKLGDMIWTMHEHSHEYGYFKVTHAEEVEQPKVKFIFDDDSHVIVSLSHRFLGVNSQWVEARALRHGDQIESLNKAKRVISIEKQGVGTVIKLEIDQAHTYIANGCISHNVKGENLFPIQEM